LRFFEPPTIARLSEAEKPAGLSIHAPKLLGACM